MCSAEVSPGFLAGGAAPPRVYVPGAPLPRLRSAQGVRRTGVTKTKTFGTGGRQEHVIIEDIIRRRRCCRRDVDETGMEIGDSPSKTKIPFQGAICSDMSSELLEIADLEIISNFPSRRDSRELSAGPSRPLSGRRPRTPGSSPASRTRRPWSSPEVRPADREQQVLLSPAGSQVGFPERAKNSPSKRPNGVHRRRSPSVAGGDDGMCPAWPPHWMHSGPFLEKGPPSPPVCAAEIFYGREGSRWQSPRLIETNPGFRGRPCLKASRRASKTLSGNLQSMASEASCQPRWSLQASTVASSVDVADLSKIESLEEAASTIKLADEMQGGSTSPLDAGFDQSWSAASGSPPPEWPSAVGESPPKRRLRGETRSSTGCSEADVAVITSLASSGSLVHCGEAEDVPTGSTRGRIVAPQSAVALTPSSPKTMRGMDEVSGKPETAGTKVKKTRPAATDSAPGAASGLQPTLSVAGVGADVSSILTVSETSPPSTNQRQPDTALTIDSPAEAVGGRISPHDGDDTSQASAVVQAPILHGNVAAGPAGVSIATGSRTESDVAKTTPGCSPASGPAMMVGTDDPVLGAAPGFRGVSHQSEEQNEISEGEVERRPRRRPAKPDAVSSAVDEEPEDEQLVEQFNALADEQKVLLNIFDQIAHGKQWGKKLITLEDILKFCRDVNRKAMKRSDVTQGIHHVVMRARQIQVDWTGARGPAVSKGLLFSSFLVAVEDIARELGMNFSELFLRAVHEYSEYASVEMPHSLSQFW
mmetsp:Transcript_9016/g.21496  ORF Transcript_9016/g.21496 Transcript_9016/m.21496 type:complete len:760 (+) Transcript_9016:16-2295(+)